MRQLKLSLIVSLLSLALLSPKSVLAEAAFGQASDIFSVGAGARSMAMGGAFTGLADDASAPYFNPAGLAYLDEHQLLAMHAPLFFDTSYNYLSSAHPFGDKWGSLAISDALLQSDGFTQRDRNNTAIDTDAEVRNNAIFASYARKLPWNLSAGTNLKLIQQKVAGFSDSALGMDVGFMYRPSKLISAGVNFANINSPKIKLNQSDDEFRPITRFGLASNVFKGVVLSADLIKVQKGDNLFAAGAEYSPTRLFSLRGGYNENRSYTFGIGINVKPFRIDYAFSDTDTGSFSKFSVTWAWHNIYKTDLEPPMKAGRAVYPLKGFDNRIAFMSRVPHHVVAKWSLKITNGEGQMVRTLGGDLRPPEAIEWDARNEMGEPVVGGKYKYEFVVDYKNGKDWTIDGDIDLDLPNHKMDEVIDMDLQLNGSQSSEDITE